ncbi:MAG: mechanosensitive ion channel [Phycisphaerae bacterium]|nr:mechanosensitive ion channel [Phycisphaerae bacterium]
MDKILEQITTWATTSGLKLVIALVILIIGRWVAIFIKGIVIKIMKKRKVDGTIISFVGSICYFLLLGFVIIAAMAKAGIQTTSFVAVVGAAGLAIGLALQGSLGNFASGFLLILFHPFREGDFIEGGGTMGIVEDIQIFTTTLATPDNKTVIVPNSKLTNDNITNYTSKGTRRVEWIIGVSYSDNLDKVRTVIQDILDNDQRIHKDPETLIKVKEMADSSINFVVRGWVNVRDFWNVFFDVNEAVKKRFDAEGICIPFPQRDVHLYEHKE